MKIFKLVLLFFVAISIQSSDALLRKKRNQARAYQAKYGNSLLKRKKHQSKKTKKSRKSKKFNKYKKKKTSKAKSKKLDEILTEKQFLDALADLESLQNETMAARVKTPKYDPEINRQDDRGRTALHRAIISNDTNLAAQLLRKGADYKIKDSRNRGPFDYAPYWMRFQIRRAYDKLPKAFVPVRRTPKKAAEIVEMLDKDGIVRLEKFVSIKNRKQLLKELAQFKGELLSRSDQELDSNCFSQKYVDNARGSLISQNPFLALPTLAEMMSMKKTKDIINGYLAGTSWVHDAKVIIPIACDSKGIDWHIDKQGNQLQLLILLADIPEETPYLSFVKGSHNLTYSYKDYSENAINLDLVKKHIKEPEYFHIHGKAGDAFLMHAEGLHKLNGFCATAACVSFSRYADFVWALDLNEDMAERALDKNNVFWATQQAVEKGQSLAPTKKYWHEGLRQFDKWIDKVEK